jgi:hypothetical protein
MTDLIVHMGLPKAGSTTIQNKVLRNQEGYLGQLNELKKDEDFAKQFKSLAPIGNRLRSDDKRAFEWSERVQQYIEEHYPSIPRVILSHEGLSQRTLETQQKKWPIGFNDTDGKSYNRLAIPFLHHFSEQYWKIGNVKVLLVLRRQPEWLASLYAERSKLNFGASQIHFEKEINQLIERQDDFIDWSQWVNDLYECLGEKNVCVLFMEDMHKQEFWKQFIEFMDISNLDINEITSQKQRKYNKRNSGSQVWNISTLYPAQTIKKNFDKSKYATRMLCELARFVSIFIDITSLDRKRDSKIFLTENMERRIMDYCRPFNIKLSEKLNVNLREKCYI